MKRLIEILIIRKITNVMLFAGICFIGMLSLKEIPVELLPHIEKPGLTVITNLSNAAPSEAEKLITSKIEESLTSVAGVAEINSESIEGTSIVRVSFAWGHNMDMALIEAKEKVDLIRGQLPEDTGKSMVIKYNPSDEPVMIFSVEVKSGIQGLRKKVEKEIVPYFERVDGVAAVDIIGGEKKEIHVEVDNNKLFSRNISLPEICDSIEVSNYSYPAGSIVKNDLEYNVRTIGEFPHVKSMDSVVVGYNESGTPVYLGNVALVKETIKKKKALVKFNGNEGVALLLRKEPGKNTVETCENINSLIKDKFQNQKKSYVFTCIYDQSRFINNSINNVFISAVLSGVISFLVLLFFFRSLKPSIIILTSIPVSVTGTFILMHLFGITINTISLGGLALGIGMMVDSGIVVLESIKINEAGNSNDLSKSVISGTLRVVSPVTVSILTTIIVFIPIVFLKGLSGALFKEMAMTVSFSLIFSLISSVLLIPMLYTVFKERGNENPSVNDKFLKIEKYYGSIIENAMEKKKTVIIAASIGFILGLALLLPVKKEIMPSIENGEFSIEVTMPGGTKLNETDEFVTTLEAFLSKYEEIDYFFSKVGCDDEENISEKISGKGSDYAKINVYLKRNAFSSVDRVISKIADDFKYNEDIKINFNRSSDIISSVMSIDEKNLNIEISGGDELWLRELTNHLVVDIQKVPGVKKVESAYDNKSPELKLLIDRPKAAFLGIDIENLAMTISTAIKGRVVSTYRDKDEEIDIRVMLRDEDKTDEKDIQRINIKSQSGKVFPISKITEIHKSTGLNKIVRNEQNPVNIVSVSSTENMESLKRRINEIISSIEKPSGYSIRILDSREKLLKAFGELGYAMILAVIFIYMLLASQFQSLLNPLIVMLSIPVTCLGVSLGLLLTGQSININSSIGMILLSGVVVNNAIVLFDVIEQEKINFKNLKEAVISAGKKRLRPILLTTFTTVLALFPLALGFGEGSELQRPLAITVMGGLSVSTVLTLVIIPVVYLMINSGNNNA